MTQRERRAEFLIKWFLDVFNGHKAPYPQRCFRGIAFHMQEFLAGSPALMSGTGQGEEKTLAYHEEHDAQVDPELRPRSGRPDDQ
jgi:hypothetical protein